MRVPRVREQVFLFSKPLVRLPSRLLWSVFAELSEKKGGEKTKGSKLQKSDVVEAAEARGCLAFSSLIEPILFNESL